MGSQESTPRKVDTKSPWGNTVYGKSLNDKTGTITVTVMHEDEPVKSDETITITLAHDQDTKG